MPEPAPSSHRIRRFDAPDERRDFELGGLDLVLVGGLSLGRARYEPGWKCPSMSAGRSASGRARWPTSGSSSPGGTS
jgi:hypothetical protein